MPELPPEEQRYGSTHVTWWETDPGYVYIHAKGGTPDDRHYASTLVAIQLSPHGFKRAQFDMDQDVEHLEPRRITSAFQDYRRGRPGRGLVHPNGSVYTWPEDDETHMGMASTLGIPHNYERCFAIDKEGQFRMSAWGSEAESLMPQVIEQTGLKPHPYYYPKYRQSRTSAWPDLMAKAKRLIQSGQVHVLRNGYNNIMGHIIGDHGEYDTEISRDDPSSRSITGWQCSCPWDQYAWQRTRKWKKFEGRPCSHVMALYWKALSTPLDEQLSEEQAGGMGTGQKLPGAPEKPETHEFGLPEETPRSFGPDGDIIQGDQESMNLPPGPEAIGGPPGPAQAPMAPPPGGLPGGAGGPEPPGVLPQFPGEQQEMQWAGPGTTPGGGVSPPGAFSVPGAKPPNQPNNPIQNPGTLSSVRNLRNIMDGDCDYGDIWIDDDKKIVYLNIGDAFGDLIDPAREAAEQEYPDHEIEILDEGGQPDNTRVAKTSAEFNPPEIVRLKKPIMGLAEGPVKGQYGDGEYREVMEGQAGEVRDQDATTGWVEVIFPLDDSGYHEPYHVKCFVEPSDIEHTNQTPPGPFIRRK